MINKTLLAVVLFLAAGLRSHAQSLDYDTTIVGASGAAWNMIVHLPPTYYSNNTDSFQAILFFVGLGETGTDSSKVGKYGPHAYIRGSQHWDGGVVLGNGTHYPVIISIQPASNYAQPLYVKPKIDAILARYRIKRNSLHMTGLSMGGWESTQFVAYQPSSGDHTYGRMVRSVVDIEGVKPDDQYGGTPAYPTKFADYASLGGRFWGFEQCQDGRDIQSIVTTMNNTVAGSATFQATCYGTGAHGYWEHEYGSDTNRPYTYLNGGVLQDIYQWMLRQGDTVSDLHSNVTPVVDAGAGQTITLPLDSVTLSGSASGVGGATIASTVWSKLSGGTATIVNGSSLSTIVRGLQAGSYSFQLAATDNLGHTGYSTTLVTVNAAPGAGPRTDYDSAWTVSGTAWNTIVHLPPTYYTHSTDSFQCIIYFVNTTESGSDSSKLAIHGPHGYLRAGWNGGVLLGNGTHYPIIITVQTPSAFQRPYTVKPLIDAILARYRIFRKSLHFTGLTTGGWVVNQYVTYQQASGDYTYGRMVRSVVDVEGVVPDDSLSYGGTYPQKFQSYASVGGRELGFEQCQDNRNIQSLVTTMNGVVAGSAYYIQTCYGTGANGYSEYFYGNASMAPGVFTVGGVSQTIYQWMLRQGDTTHVDTTAGAAAGVTASVGRSLLVNDVTEKVALYPNPASGRAWLQWVSGYAGAGVVSLYSSAGALVRTIVVQKPAGDHRVELDLSGLGRGVYFVGIRRGDGVIAHGGAFLSIFIY